MKEMHEFITQLLQTSKLNDEEAAEVWMIVVRSVLSGSRWWPMWLKTFEAEIVARDLLNLERLLKKVDFSKRDFSPKSELIKNIFDMTVGKMPDSKLEKHNIRLVMDIVNGNKHYLYASIVIGMVKRDRFQFFLVGLLSAIATFALKLIYDTLTAQSTGIQECVS